MYIDRFVAGIIFTILAEFVVAILYGIFHSKKK